MAYERITVAQADVYHYTKKENLDNILLDGKIRKYRDKECWFCDSLEDTLRLMELTVMNEGGLYIGVNELPMRYPKFCSDDFVILKLTPRYQNGEWVKWHQQVDSGCINGKKCTCRRIQKLKAWVSWGFEV